MRIIRPVKVNTTGTLTRATVGTYWDKSGTLQTAPANTLRITYDPNDLTKPPYALIEQAATNYIAASEDFGTFWAGYFAMPTLTKAYPAPNGTNTATRLSTRDGGPVDSPGISGLLTYNNTETVLKGVAVGSIWARCVSGTLGIDFGKDDTFGGQYTLTTSWQRLVWVDYNASINPGDRVMQIKEATMNNQEWEVWGAQLEINPAGVPSSYIPSFAAPNGTTRAADVVTGKGLIYSNVPENDYPVWSATKAYTAGDRMLDPVTHKVFESTVGITGTATTTSGQLAFSAKKADGTVYVPAVGSRVAFSGTVPTNVTVGYAYYVKTVTSGVFSIADSPTGSDYTVNTVSTPFSATFTTNVNQQAPNSNYWLDAGYDNRWDMFDDSITSQTIQSGDISIVFNPGARLDSIAGLNMAANGMKVAFTDLTTGSVTYSAKANLISNSGVQDFYRYMYEPIVQMPDCLIDGIPLGLSTNSVITVTFQSNGTTKVGGVVFGLSKDIGVTEWGAKVGVVDYSVKTKDNFGNYTITPRAFSKKGDFTVQVPTGQVDALENTLAQYRSTPIVYIGSNTGKDRTQFNSTIIYGFYKDFDINISYNAYSVCSMSIEGLT